MNFTPELMEFLPERTRSIIEKIVSELSRLESLLDEGREANNETDLDKEWIQERIDGQRERARFFVRAALTNYRFVNM